MNLEKVHQYSINSIHELDEIADLVISLIPNMNLVLLQGDLGAGKTTLTQIICKKLGFNQAMSSPTYAIVNEYSLKQGAIHQINFLYHIDLYRLEDLQEAMNIGIENYLNDKNAVCFIEWPEVIGPLIDEAILIKLSHNSTGFRQIDVYLYK